MMCAQLAFRSHFGSRLSPPSQSTMDLTPLQAKLKETEDIIYVLDWQSNARTIYEKHMGKCDCPDICVMPPIPEDLLNFVMLPLEDTREIMDNICD